MRFLNTFWRIPSVQVSTGGITGVIDVNVLTLFHETLHVNVHKFTEEMCNLCNVFVRYITL